MKFNEQHISFVAMVMHSLATQLSTDLGKDYKECLNFMNAVSWYCQENDLQNLARDREAFDKIAAGFAKYVADNNAGSVKHEG